MRPLVIILILAASVSEVCFGQNTTRKGLKLKQTVTTVNTDSTAATIKSLKISGYEKGQYSTTESMFVTNESTVHVKAINITITYLNMRGEVLHRHTETIECDLPPRETRSIDLKSWDKQKLWYYKNSQARRNGYSNPFDVKVKINYIEY